jgi:hypothetical protein
MNPYHTGSKNGGGSHQVEGDNERDNNKKRGALDGDSDDSLGGERPANKRVKTKGKQNEGKEKEDDSSMREDDEDDAMLWSHFDDSDWDWNTIFGAKTKGKQREGKEKEDDSSMREDEEDDDMLWGHFDDSDWDWNSIFQYWP